ncbi:sodium channel protein 1 brain-like isoform X2 [Symsagittifera roscoffensis]|uniref:sodium channel protein 1 brain-like isoform X2 n=1 Tax=Symsagittifera roscoffensis TaxID=84072 RepID=UPI00307BCB90
MTNNASASVDGDPFLNIETHSHIKPLTRDALRKMHKAAVGPNSLVNSSGAEEHNEHSRVNKSISNSLAVPGTQPGGSGGEFPPRLSISQRSLSIALALEAQHRAQNESKTCGCFPPLCATEGADHALEEDRPNADLDEGRNLPSIYEPLSAEMEGIPLEEIDANRKRQKTFVIISKRMGKHSIYRFSATRALFLLGPLDVVRKGALFVATNQWFDAVVILCILINCVFLGLSNQVKVAEYVFQAFYTIEMIIRVTARGFALNRNTYLRDPWNVLDFAVIIIGYVIIVMEETNSGPNMSFNVSSLRTFRVLRALKTISVVPGLRTIVNALLKSLRMLMEVMVLTLFCLCVAALLGLQLYMGVLRNKCVLNAPKPLNHSEYDSWINDEYNYYLLSSIAAPQLCGNYSYYIPVCPKNYTCIEVGDNPNSGYTNFDTFGWAMMTSFQLITLDFWENVYDYLLRAAGPWHISFFIILVFFGSFYLINLMLAVVTMSYEEESDSVEKEEKEEQETKEQMEQLSKWKKQEQEKAAAAAALIAAGGAATGLNPGGNRKISTGRKISKSFGEESDKEGTRNRKTKSSTVSEPGDIAGAAAASSDLASSKTKNSIKGSQDKLADSEKAQAKRNSWSRFKESGKRGSEGGALGDTIDEGIGDDGEEEDLDFEDDDDDESSQGLPEDPQKQLERLNSMWCCGNGCTKGCCGCCGPPDTNRWLPVQLVVYKWVTDPIFDIIVTLLIGLNTLFLALDYHNMPATLEEVLGWGNQIFTAFFMVEALLKIIAMGSEYFKNSWNVFDFVIVLFSILEVIISAVFRNDGFDGLTILRVLRLMRVFKLARSWATMRVLLAIIWSTMGALGNLTLILVIVIYIFAVIGMQLLGDGYTQMKWDELGDPLPRWNFSNFFHSFMMVFRILCGEWIEALYDCMRAKGEILCMAIILSTLIIGNFLVLNLFLALLLNKFNQENLKKEQKKERSLKVGWKRLQGLLKKNTRVQPRLLDVINAAKTATGQDNGGGDGSGSDPQQTISPLLMALRRAKAEGRLDDVIENTNDPGNESMMHGADNQSNGHVRSFKSSSAATRNGTDNSSSGLGRASQISRDNRGGHRVSFQKQDEDEKDSIGDSSAEVELVDCFPEALTTNCSGYTTLLDSSTVGKAWIELRRRCFNIVDHRFFEWFILGCILISSISLAFEDIYLKQRPTLESTLVYMNYCFVFIFSTEMLLKWLGLGFTVYFTNGWCCLDFLIVLVSISGIVVENVANVESLDAFRSLRTLRALRPLRAISRWQGMKIVVNALASAIPSILNVLLVCIVFWLIFSIMGVQLMKGRFYACYERASGDMLECGDFPDVEMTREWCENHTEYRWTNQKVNFDNVLAGYLALFQVATFEGWMEVMAAATDITDYDRQPCLESNILIYLYFIFFIICGSFFTLNLFIGVIIENFNRLKKKYDGEGPVDIMLTETQRNYYNTLKRLGARKPKKTVKRPKWSENQNQILAFFFDISTSTKFEIAIAIVILSNMITMAMDHYKMSDIWNYALFCLNIMFTTIYSLECIVKIVGLRQQYFLYAWNIFDFIIVLVSITDIVIEAVVDSKTMFLKPGTLRVIRLFRIGRVLRLIKAAKGIRKLLFAFLISIPALFNIGMLLTLMLFIYALIGMSLFGYTIHNGMLNDRVNFETFSSSMTLLFRLMTSGGWNEILEALMVDNETTDCDPDMAMAGIAGNCGVKWAAVAYMVSFLLVTFLIVINMYIAVILENFNQAHQQEEIGITEDDLEMFYSVWQRYDPQATEYIHYLLLQDFCDDLDPPFRLPKPNGIKIVTLKLPINQDEKVHCLDILKALVKSVIGDFDDSEQLTELQGKIEEKFKESFPNLKIKEIKSDTFRRKQEDHAARRIQKAWFHHKFRQNIRRVSSTYKTLQLNRSNMPSGIESDSNSVNSRSNYPETMSDQPGNTTQPEISIIQAPGPSSPTNFSTPLINKTPATPRVSKKPIAPPDPKTNPGTLSI